MPGTSKSGRKRLATAVKIRNGSFVGKPGRFNSKEPQVSTERPKLPTSLHKDPIAKRTWHRILDYLTDMKVIAITDSELVETYASNQSLLLRSRDGMNTDNDKLQREATANFHKCLDRSPKLLTEFGLTSASRSKLVARTDDVESDLLASFMAAGGKKGSKN